MMQIYFMIFRRKPFDAYGLDGLIGDMINFVEDLPAEWRSQWEEMKRTTKNGADYILGKSLLKAA